MVVVAVDGGGGDRANFAQAVGSLLPRVLIKVSSSSLHIAWIVKIYIIPVYIST